MIIKANNRLNFPSLALLLILDCTGTGCNNLNRLLNGKPAPSNEVPPIQNVQNPIPNQAQSNLFSIGAGQSNMEGMNLNGEFKSEMLNNGFTNMAVPNIALGGTELARWEKGGDLYSRIIQAYNTYSGDRRLCALLFWQGESDALGLQNDYSTWGFRFERLIDDVRIDLNMPNLPIVFVQLGKVQTYGPRWDSIKAQQAAIHKSNVYMIKSDDIEQRLDDHLHYSPEDYDIMMKRLADKLKEVL